ncbi:hypothetical protein Tco_1169128, partial [Tanacetum coccineum]
LAVPVFNKGDDLIDAINKMMSFLSTIVSSRFPSTNNQLRNSSNPRQHAIINDGRVTIQPYQGRTNSHAAGTYGSRVNSASSGGQNSSQQRVEKVLLVEAQGMGKVLSEEELEFLADPAKVTLMANFSRYGLDVLSEVPNPDNTHNNMLNQSVQEM